MQLQCSDGMREGESSLFLKGQNAQLSSCGGWCLPHRADGQVTTMYNKTRLMMQLTKIRRVSRGWTGMCENSR